MADEWDDTKQATKQGEWDDVKGDVKPPPVTLDDIKECLDQLIELEECKEKPTGFEIISGPRCGLPVFLKKGECVVFNPETKTFESLELMAGELLGIPAPADKNLTCDYERVAASVCNPGEADLVLAPADIIALIAGEAFNDAAATAVDIAAAEQDLIGATVTGFACNSKVKHGEELFTVTTAEVCVQSASGDLMNLQQGGQQPLGDTYASDDTPVVIDESVVIPAGSAARFCFDVKLYLDANGAPVASPYASAKG